MHAFDVSAGTDYALLFLRLMIALVFGYSGYNHATKAEERSKSIGMSKGFTLFLGVAEMAGAAGIILGVLTQWAAIGLLLIMAGAIQKKVMVWKTGFWGKDSLGWNYDLIFTSMLLAILTTAGGALTLTH
jgi:putative oxidoreductase